MRKSGYTHRLRRATLDSVRRFHFRDHVHIYWIACRWGIEGTLPSIRASRVSSTDDAGRLRVGFWQGCAVLGHRG